MTGNALRLVNLAGIAAVLVLNLAGDDARGAAAVRSRPVADSLAGQLLVATPQLTDPRFVQTVVYLVRHNASGALGVVVNRPLGDVPMARVLEPLGIDATGVSGSIPVHYGGPVERARGLVLHTADYVGEGTLVVNNTMALTAHPEVLRAMAAGEGPRRTLFAVGYAGWGPGQLDAEIDAGHWITVPSDEGLVFDDDYRSKWEQAIARRTIKL